MKPVNYNESVILPYLQKKVQDVLNNNLILEASLLVEQAKNKDLFEEIGQATKEEVHELKQKELKHQEFVVQVSSRVDELKKLGLAKDNVILEREREIANLKDSLSKSISQIGLINSISLEKEKEISSLKQEVSAMRSQIEANVIGKTRKQKLVEV
jgi:hypothetical protein